jgi:hypothetical protein
MSLRDHDIETLLDHGEWEAAKIAIKKLQEKAEKWDSHYKSDEEHIHLFPLKTLLDLIDEADCVRNLSAVAHNLLSQLDRVRSQGMGWDQLWEKAEDLREILLEPNRLKQWFEWRAEAVEKAKGYDLLMSDLVMKENGVTRKATPEEVREALEFLLNPDLLLTAIITSGDIRLDKYGQGFKLSNGAILKLKESK